MCMYFWVTLPHYHILFEIFKTKFFKLDWISCVRPSVVRASSRQIAAILMVILSFEDIWQRNNIPPLSQPWHSKKIRAFGSWNFHWYRTRSNAIILFFQKWERQSRIFLTFGWRKVTISFLPFDKSISSLRPRILSASFFIQFFPFLFFLFNSEYTFFSRYRFLLGFLEVSPPWGHCQGRKQ